LVKGIVLILTQPPHTLPPEPAMYNLSIVLTSLAHGMAAASVKFI